MLTDEISWNRIFSYWNLYCQDYNPLMNHNPLFEEIKVTIKKLESPNYQLGNEIIDWWSNDTKQNKIDLLSNYGLLGVNWRLPTGLKRTVEMMWDHKDNHEDIALIWLASSLNEISTYFPHHWQGNGTYLFVKQVLNEIYREMRERNIWTWHGSVRNFLPITIEKSIFSTPSNLSSLVQIATLDCITVRNSWTLVCVSKDSSSIS
ncbi:hypothetical protein ACFYU8_14835 [Brevibacillus sp. NPDC003359]|uniref:hypothetical protein n=1 Tax=unclassified Brevibacillus TaxID=2684853 RepID=UPI00368DBD07